MATGIGVAYGACVITYEALPTDDVFHCTRVEMRDSDGNHYAFTDDEDGNPSNGSQCHLAVSAGGEGAQTCEGLNHLHLIKEILP